MKTFEELGLSHELLNSVKKLGFEKPTEIQEESIPLIIKGQDVIGESATGSGKTLAFGCGVFEKVKSGNGLQALIMTPTRELAEQVKDSIKELTQQKHLNVTPIYGGVAIGPQIRDLSRSEVVVGTPGRLLDHLGRGTINLSKVKLLVLDEADRMLEMGFIEDVEQIIQKCPRERQSLCFSATISSEIRGLSERYMKNPEKISATNQVDPSKLKQTYYNVPKNLKLSLLVHLLQQEKSKQVIVFCNTRTNTDFVVKNLQGNSINAVAIHGGMVQSKRLKTLKSFNDGRMQVLACTDVASRGLHIENVSHVYNYDIPKDSKDYVHRIGRTARAGKEGQAVNILCEYDYENFSRVKDDYRDFNIDKIEIPYVKRIVAIRVEHRRGGQMGGRFGRNGGGHNRGYNRGSNRGPNRGQGRGQNDGPNRGYNRGSNQGSNRGKFRYNNRNNKNKRR